MTLTTLNAKKSRNLILSGITGLACFIFASLVIAAPPAADSNIQIRLNQIGYYPSAEKTATLLVDHKLGEEDLTDSYQYRWEVLNLDTGNVARSYGYREPVSLERLIHSLPAGHAGPSDRYKSGDELKPFYNPTNKRMYQWTFTPLSTQGNYRVQLKRRSTTSMVEEIMYVSPDFFINTNQLAHTYSELADDAFAYYYFHRMGEILTPQGMRAAGIDDKYARVKIHGEGYPCLDDWCGVGETLGAGTAWADAGDFGVYPVNHAIAAWQLLNSVEFLDEPGDLSVVNADVPIPSALQIVNPDSNGRVRVLEEVIVGSQYLKNMLPSNATLLAPHKIHNDNWGAGLGSWQPQDELPGTNNGSVDNTIGRRAAAPSTASTLAICRTSAHISRLLYKFGYNERANEWRDLANEAQFRAEGLPVKLYYRPEVADPATGDSLMLFNGGGPYNDGNVNDDFYACNVERYLTLLAAKAAGESVSDTAISTAKTKVTSNAHFAVFPNHFDWKDVTGAANISLLSAETDLSVAQKNMLINNIVAVADSKLELLQPYTNATMGGLFTYNPRLPTTLANITDASGTKPGLWYWGSNSFIVNDAQLLSVASRVTTSTSQANSFAEAALHAMDYILGENAVNLSFVTGYGEYAEEDTHDRHAWTTSQANSIPYPRGWLSGGPQNDWATCFVKEHKESLERPWETETPFLMSADGSTFVSADEVWDLFSTAERNTAIDELYFALYTNSAMASSQVPALGGMPLQPNFPANAYAAIGTAPDGWCTKENTINWNSGLLWMATAAARYLPTQIGNEPSLIGGNVEVTRFLRPREEWPPGGECADIVLTNTSTQTVEWEGLLSEFNGVTSTDGGSIFTPGTKVRGTIFDFWNVEWVQESGTVLFAAADYAWWGDTLSPGESTPFGQFGYCSGGDDDRETTPPPSGDVVQVNVYDDFNGGFCADVTVTNPLTTSWTWEVDININSGTRAGSLRNVWNMTCLQGGVPVACEGRSGTVRIKGVGWNDTLSAGEQTHSIGFCANKL